MSVLKLDRRDHPSHSAVNAMANILERTCGREREALADYVRLREHFEELRDLYTKYVEAQQQVTRTERRLAKASARLRDAKDSLWHVRDRMRVYGVPQTEIVAMLKEVMVPR